MIMLFLQRVRWFLQRVPKLWKRPKGLYPEDWGVLMFCPYRVGQQVYDDLTGEIHTVIGVEYAEGQTHPEIKSNPKQMSCWGIYLDSSYLDGARHPWELSAIPSKDS